MNKTKIEWVKSPDGTQGYTWNPITGCQNGCEYCYARKLANTRLKKLYQANLNHDPNMQYKDPFYPRFWEDRVAKMGLYTGVGKGIFVCDMSDLFGIGIPERWTKVVLEAISINRRNRFYLLTKQPQNLIKFSPFPDNCWVGVSVTNREQFHNANFYIPEIDAKVKYISFEPLLDDAMQALYGKNLIQFNKVQWVIIGAQTKPYKPPKIEWVQEIVEACDKAGIPVFLKNNLYDLLMDAPHSDLFWEDMSHLRQEMPR